MYQILTHLLYNSIIFLSRFSANCLPVPAPVYDQSSKAEEALSCTFTVTKSFSGRKKVHLALICKVVTSGIQTKKRLINYSTH